MSDLPGTILKAKMAELESATQAQTLEGVLADFMILYRAAETQSVEEVRDGLGQMADKLQAQRAASLNMAATVERLSADIQVKMRQEAEEAQEEEKAEAAG